MFHRIYTSCIAIRRLGLGLFILLTRTHTRTAFSTAFLCTSGSCLCVLQQALGKPLHSMTGACAAQYPRRSSCTGYSRLRSEIQHQLCGMAILWLGSEPQGLVRVPLNCDYPRGLSQTMVTVSPARMCRLLTAGSRVA
ncbi:uncharacterized protein C8Q71DRAFT_280933 [Rhodofomes roseus]|uniref:Secreted protein n=1 Tax=Rhodofomes roseus TaxID=34475 RepID=A0ABQ8K6G3_9APHY|nr:uncharacterized protein C8Q71DRAFT_280933 [Rhodofomes roseus]KAH9832086.1 hypothetical protein C8Q71DRAFT_280933 [Rhodofomes roseus]